MTAGTARVVLCRLYRNISSYGNTYFSGPMGGVKLALLKTRDVSDTGQEIWELVVEERPAKPIKNATVAAERAGRLFAPRGRSDGRELPDDPLDDIGGEP
jgi:hypothetical protein